MRRKQRQIGNYKQVEHAMEAVRTICSISMVILAFYMIGITGALENEALELAQAVVRMGTVLLGGAAIYGVKAGASYIQETAARRRVFLTNDWTVYR